MIPFWVKGYVWAENLILLSMRRYVLRYFVICFGVLCINGLFGAKPLSLQSTRIETPPVIDGKLDDACWLEHTQVDRRKFTQIIPVNLGPSRFETEIRVAYTDAAMYVAARLYDTSPDSIQTELGLRDDGNRNVDMFGVGFDTYFNQQNAFVFWVTAAGVQGDIYVTPDGDDPNWNAVWKSEVNIDDQGWTVEMEIPLFNLRFPKQHTQTWGINFYRQVKRYNSEAYWNPVDATVNGSVNQYGMLEGLENIQPPLRLSATPYVSGQVSYQAGQAPQFNAAGGMDLKYGLNESFTLDMSLIPDFSQVRSDNLVLNLSPFEVRFDENRPFFTEGTELFNQDNLFYSRRVGGTYGITGEVAEDEKIISRPSQAPLINATKFSGRNKRGLGIGVFNALTNRTTAIAARTYQTADGDTLTEQREVAADPLTNFNVVVFDQNLRNNSNVSVINTNVFRQGGARDANVTAGFFNLNDKTNTWQVKGSYAYSQLFEKDADTSTSVKTPGYAYFLGLGKVSGNWQYYLYRNVESDDYNVNDMGFLRAPNEVLHGLELSWRKNEPFGIWNNVNINTNLEHNQTYAPREYDNFDFNLNVNQTFKNFWYLYTGIGGAPFGAVNHFSARADGYVLRQPASGRARVFLNTDQRKKFRMGLGGGIWTRPEWESLDNWLDINPRYRFSDRFTLEANASFQYRRREIGYIEQLFNHKGDMTNILYGNRYAKVFTQLLTGQFTFNPYMALNLRVRNYWNRVAYDRLFFLGEDGYLNENDLPLADSDGNPNYDQNYAVLTVDMVYTWQFAPGSFLTVVWKNFSESFSQDTRNVDWQTYSNQLFSDQVNTLSFRVVYFLNAPDVGRAFRRMSS